MLEILKRMKKFRLDDIDKSSDFTSPPEGYFDRLPQVIQSRTAARSGTRNPGWTLVWRMVPVAAAMALIIWVTGVFKDQPGSTTEDLLAEVTAADIINYLEDSDLTPEEILEEVDVQALSDEIYQEDQIIDALEIEDQILLDWYGDEGIDRDWL